MCNRFFWLCGCRISGVILEGVFLGGGDGVGYVFTEGFVFWEEALGFFLCFRVIGDRLGC